VPVLGNEPIHANKSRSNSATHTTGIGELGGGQQRGHGQRHSLVAPTCSIIHRIAIPLTGPRDPSCIGTPIDLDYLGRWPPEPEMMYQNATVNPSSEHDLYLKLFITNGGGW
jgi:hypothetical protein